MSILNNALPPKKRKHLSIFFYSFIYVFFFRFSLFHSVCDLWSFCLSFCLSLACQFKMPKINLQRGNTLSHTHARARARAKEEFCMFIRCPCSMILPALCGVSLLELQKLLKIWRSSVWECVYLLCPRFLLFFCAYFVIFFGWMFILTTWNRNTKSNKINSTYFINERSTLPTTTKKNYKTSTNNKKQQIAETH